MYYLQIDESSTGGDTSVLHFATQKMANEYAAAYWRRYLVECQDFTREAVAGMTYEQLKNEADENASYDSQPPSIYIGKVTVNSEKSIGRHVFNAMRDGFMARLKGFDYSKPF